MAVNPLTRSNPIRMMGMASGMDTQSIIDATLRMHRFKIDQQVRNRTLIEWKQKYHNDIKDQINSLRSTYLSNLGSKTMMNRNTFNTNLAKATIGGVETNAVSVSATVNASVGSLTIDYIQQLAKNSTASSSASVSANKDGFLQSQTLGSLNFAGGGSENGITFGPDKANLTTTSGGTITLDKSVITGSEVEWSDGTSHISVSKGQDAYSITLTKESDGTYKFDASMVKGTESPKLTSGTVSFDVDGVGIIEFDDGTAIEITKNGENDNIFSFKAYDDESEEFASGANVFTFSGKYTDGDTEVGFRKDAYGNITQADGRAINYYGETNFDITIGSETKTINLTSNMTISEMLAKVNSEVPGITMSYDRMQDKFTVTAKDNSTATFIIKDNENGGDIVSKMFGTGTVNGSASQKAIVKINGGEEMTLDSNTLSYRGVNITFRETSDEPITVTVTRDTDKAVNAIKDFIDSYNTLIKKLEDMLNERKSSKERGYTPLTDEEKASMTDKQIEEWEAIAKKGILRDDKGIQNLVSSLRASFFEQIEGTGLSASQIGLSTGSYFEGTGGQIIVNEDRLRAALEADPDRVADVFVKIDSSNGLRGVGLMHKIDGLLNDFTKMNGTQSYTLDALEKSYNEMNERIAKLEERMWAEEDKLYRQFAAMETAMSKMQQQGDWFTAMLGAK